MASLRRVSSLTSGLLTNTGVVSSIPLRGARSSLLVNNSQFKNDARKQEDNEFWKEETDTAAIYDETVKCKESQSFDELKKSRSVTSDGTSYSDKKIASAQSGSIPKHFSTRFGKSLPWHSLLSLLKPNLNIQPLRYKSCALDCDIKCEPKKKCEEPICYNFRDCPPAPEECKPKSKSLCLPLTCCVIKRKPPKPCLPCVQKKWPCCDKSMCLPCCCPVEKPLRCKVFDIKLNTCPRKTYRIAAYSECNKRYSRKQHKKECCYTKRICYARNICDREVKPLIHIKDRQALVLGFKIKAMCDTPCECPDQ